jgi:cardiolipin synthase
VLGYFSHLPVWLVLAVVTRDIFIVGAIMLSGMLARPVSVRPLLISKANTVGQIVLAAMVLGDLGFAAGLERVVGVMIWITGGLTVLSAVTYLVNWLTYMASYEEVPQKKPRPARTSGKKARVSRRKAPVTGS